MGNINSCATILNSFFSAFVSQLLVDLQSDRPIPNYVCCIILISNVFLVPQQAFFDNYLLPLNTWFISRLLKIESKNFRSQRSGTLLTTFHSNVRFFIAIVLLNGCFLGGTQVRACKVIFFIFLHDIFFKSWIFDPTSTRANLQMKLSRTNEIYENWNLFVSTPNWHLTLTSITHSYVFPRTVLDMSIGS